MTSLQKYLVSLLCCTIAFSAKAAPKEAPPMEPPYTNDSEFDPLMGEDPSATSSSPIPTSPAVQATPSPAPNARPAPSTAESTLDNYDTASPPGRTEQVARPPLERRKGVKMIPHPNAKKGLIRIEQDGTYVYKVKAKKTDSTGTLRMGQMQAPEIVSADGQTNFATMYETESLPMVMFDYDWTPFTSFGKLGVELGVGFAMATGKGRFLKNGDTAEEVYTFVAIPVNLGLTYRFQYARNQWVAPYVAGGGTYIGVAEVRDDNKQNYTGTPALYGAGGLMFNVGAIDRDVAFNLENEYGVGGLWVAAEFRYQKALSEDLDFSGNIITLGVSAEF